MSENTTIMVALVVALIVSIAMIIMYQRKIIRADTISGVSEIFQSLPVTMGSGLFGKIWEYSKTAVLTVEQLVKTGQIQPDDQSRKNAAMQMVEQAAKVDEVPFGAAENEVASACIEAAVQQLPRNQKPPNE